MFQWWQADAKAFPEESRYENGRGKEIAHRFNIVDYQSMAAEMTLTSKAHVFSALDQLSPVGRQAVAEIWDQLRAQRPRVRLLNDPRKVLTRFVLLERLHREGLNSFRVFRAADARNVDKFPVFVRSDKKHNGALTDLITSPDALKKAILALRARGNDIEDLMVVEYVDARDNDGRFRKYAAFRVGDRILPSHILVNEHWMVKSDGSERSLVVAQAEADFQLQGEYNSWISRVFELAGIDYGRLDFGVVNGVPQAWEINMQPTLGRGPGDRKPRPQDEITAAFEAVRSRFHVGLREAFASLDCDAEPEPEPLVVHISTPVMHSLNAARHSAERRTRVRTFLSRAYHSPALGSPLRWMYRQLLPRG